MSDRVSREGEGDRVHNHAPHRPVCNERSLPNGQLRGACLDDDCTCTYYVVDYSDPERYHQENVDREDDPRCPVHAGGKGAALVHGIDRHTQDHLCGALAGIGTDALAPSMPITCPQCRAAWPNLREGDCWLCKHPVWGHLCATCGCLAHYPPWPEVSRCDCTTEGNHVVAGARCQERIDAALAGGAL